MILATNDVKTAFNKVNEYAMINVFLRGERMNSIFLTDRGQVRSHNEDAGGIYYNTDKQVLAIIADGMGGHQAGDVASQMAATEMQKKWENSDKLTSPEDTEKWLYHAIEEINESIYEHALRHEECQGMGTTLVIAVCLDDFITIAHIGDSRCYLFSEEGFKQVTEDHSLVNALVQSGQISKTDAHHHPRKNVVLKALGTEKQVIPDVKTLSHDKESKILLCSDGLTDKVLDDELATIIQSEKAMSDMAQALIDLANERGGEDNISLILIHHVGQDPLLEEGENAC